MGQMIRASKQLRMLSISGCEVTCLNFAALLQEFPQLDKLVVNIRVGAGYCHSFAKKEQFLCLSGHETSSFDILKAVISTCRRLQRLNILRGEDFALQLINDAMEDEHSNKITEVEMEELFTNCPHLRNVAFLFPAKITKRTLEVVLNRRMAAMMLLFGKETASISKEDVAWFLQQAKELQLTPKPYLEIFL